MVRITTPPFFVKRVSDTTLLGQPVSNDPCFKVAVLEISTVGSVLSHYFRIEISIFYSYDMCDP
jgi:hypothetical protein